MNLLALVPLLAGLLVGCGGALGWRGLLHRGAGTGVRTAATLRSDAAFHLANRVAGVPTMAAGMVGLATGVAALFAPGTSLALLIAALGVAGMLALVVAGGVLGHHAASRLAGAGRGPPGSARGCAPPAYPARPHPAGQPPAGPHPAGSHTTCAGQAGAAACQTCPLGEHAGRA